MTEPKTLVLIRCRCCNGEYFGNDTRLTLNPGNEERLPDEISIIVRKVPRCQGCNERIDRTRGGTKRMSRYKR